MLRSSLDDYLIKNVNRGWVYDIESYPNFFCITFYNGEIYRYFQVGFGVNEIRDINEFIEGKTLIGYNSLSYDDLVLSYLYTYGKNFSQYKDEMSITQTAKCIFDFSQKVIQFHSRKKGSKEEPPEIIKEVRSSFRKWSSLDLMRVGGFQKSLKLLAISLKHNLIQDLPYPFDKEIESSWINEVKSYNENDCVITYKLLRKLEQKIELRYILSNEYDINLMNDSDSGIANKILQHYYREYLQTNSDEEIDWDSLRTSREDILIGDCISNKVRFTTRSMRIFLESFKKTLLEKEKGYDMDFPIVEIGNRKYQLGVGGIHSVDDARKFQSTHDMEIIDADVASYYPAIILNEKIKPDHLGDEFFDILSNLRSERLKYKESGDKIKSDGLKIVINSIFGKLGFPGFILYDKYAFYQVTLNGQMYLLMLIEALNQAGIEVISANTDGVLSMVRSDQKEVYNQICQKWSEELSFDLEFETYSVYVRRDVNNYLSVNDKGKIKSKGVFYQKIDLEKGFDKPVVRYALKSHYVDGQDYRKFIRSHDDVLDFCMSQKVGSQYSDVIFNDEPVQKSIRYYVSPTGGFIYKVKEDGSRASLCAGKTVELLNNYDPSSKYNIDYSYYEEEVRKIIKEIDTVKTERESLF